MKMKKIMMTLMVLAGTALSAQAQDKFVGGDISMLTKYEEAGVVYRDKSGKTVQPLEFFKAQGLNAMRVRLFVDPSLDSDKGVCQDLDYVKKLGKRIKDAGMSFMLDFHYSDSWADPGKQWTPDAWKDLTDAQLLDKVYEYTKDCLQQLKAAGATPDFIQTGNEISYGMLWGTKEKVGSNQVNRCYTNSPAANWNRFFNLLKKAGQACREVCPQAKIVLHSERTPKENVLTDYFDRMKTNSVDYDIIGLSYYPDHHGSLAVMENAIKTLEKKNYGKDIMIVETGYGYKWAIGDEYDYTATYPLTEEGQRKFTADMIEKLNQHSSVKGLFWWWPEDNGNAGVTDSWWNAGLYNHDTGQPYAAFYELKAFTGAEVDDSDVTSQYMVNPKFDSDISGWTNTGGTAQWKQNNWEVLSNYCEFGWTGSAIADQEVVQTPTLPAGSYKLSINCATDNGAKGLFLIAGDQSVEMVGTGGIGAFTVEFTVASAGPVKLGVKLQSTTATWVNFDNFTLTKTTATDIQTVSRQQQASNGEWYTLDGRRLQSTPTRKGLYIHNGRKVIY